MLLPQRPFASRQRTSRTTLTSLALAAGLLLPALSHASATGDSLRQLTANAGVTRSVALSDLGITDAVVLTGGASQDFYLPVPKNLTLANAAIAFDGHYLKGQTGTASVVLSVDGQPALSQALADGDGLLQRSLAVAPRVHGAGFVRLGVNLLSNTGVRHCEDPSAAANSIVISPQTRLTYRVETRAVTSLDDAWSTLPGAPVLLVSGAQLEQAAFDSAWRLGVALERGGKRVSVRTLPAVGENVDTRGLAVPDALAAIPAFAALRDNTATHKLASDAELGALIVLGAPSASGDVVVADAALRARLAGALDALNAQLASDPDAQAGLKAWRASHATLADTALAAQQIRLATLGEHTVLAVSPDAGAQAAGLFDDTLRRVLTTDSVVAPIARPDQRNNGKFVSLANLGGSAQAFDVLARGDWTVSFPLAAIAADSRMPAEITLYVAAAPGPSSSRPVATIYWNGVLLAAKQLRADGQPEQLRARVPGYVLGVNNNLRLSVQRQPYSADCNETPQAYPVNVLPASSYISAGDAAPNGTFIGLLPLMAGHPQLIVPRRYLATAPDALSRVIGLALASGLSPTQTELTVANGDAAVKPAKPFLAMEVAIDGASPSARVSDGRRLQIRGTTVDWLDVTGLTHLSSAEVVSAHGEDGLLWYAIGATPAAGAQPAAVQPFVLNRGNLAILGDSGPLAWIDSGNPDASMPPGAGETQFYEWRRYVSWGVPIIAITLFVFLTLFILATRARRKNQNNAE
ncbi:cellulose biosynthesis cyclic di-GMP-binding regulatory protein BcsB [Paraburkholderia unamae]|uniref:Cyclic di-GMP-binding protein n=1 Tax=Paraburkholderia unamae TaxID=219649 RepID=A0ABX5KHK9_9BURK|nr:cellulose biosynthesis cyclic di-GMP-binding regulatory protein BcsB [Paraburkholderia unamae]PVX79935.1 hypothetical protein C7402_112122 [Paraburkholderia unamae]